MIVSHFCFRRARLAAALFVAVSVLTAAGCASKSKVAISGKVTYKGEPVGRGNVRFFGADGTLWSAAPLNSDGTFTATDIPPGEVQVALQMLPAIPRPKNRGDSGDGSVDDFNAGGKAVQIPQKYQDPKTSDLRYTIKGGKNHLDITLQ